MFYIFLKKINSYGPFASTFYTRKKVRESLSLIFIWGREGGEGGGEMNQYTKLQAMTVCR